MGFSDADAAEPGLAEGSVEDLEGDTCRWSPGIAGGPGRGDDGAEGASAELAVGPELTSNLSDSCLEIRLRRELRVHLHCDRKVSFRPRTRPKDAPTLAPVPLLLLGWHHIQ